MGLLSKLKEALGMGDTERRTTHDTTVQVERERETETGSSRTGPESRTAGGHGTTGGPETTTARSESTAARETPTPPAGGGSAAEPTRAQPEGEPVDSIKGIGPSYSEKLGEAGIETTDQLATADARELSDETGIPESRIQEWIDRANAP